MALINNDTYFVDPSRDLSQKKTYYRGLVTLLDYDMAKFSQRILQGFIKVQYHLSKSEYWVPTSILREATVTDFKIGDIVMDNTLGIIELEIIDIDISKAPPLVAVELDESRNKTTIKTYLEPFECILLDREEITEELNMEPMPLNNEGRTYCWWCKGGTKLVDGFTSRYTICSICGK